MTGTGENSTIKAVSLFSGLGGLDIGLHRAGIETVVCVEKDETAAETLKINSSKHDTWPDQKHISVRRQFPWTVIDRDIRNIDAADILAEGGISRGEIDLVVGGPPCQTFSRSNEGSRSGTAAEKGKLYEEFAKILHQIEPAAFLFENVRGLKSANNGEDLKMILDALEGDTYTADYQVLNAANYGVPQTRKRIFIVGTRQDQSPAFPEPTHTENGDGNTKPWVTAGEALESFDTDEMIEDNGGYQNAIGSKYGPLLKDIPAGANYQHFSERKYDPEQEEYVERDESERAEKRFDWRSRHWNYLLKMDQDRPSWTIQADPGTTVGPFHWRVRKLSLLEQMKLMDLPLKYYIAGTPGKVQKQIGNAVPPGLAAAVGRELATSLDLTPRPRTNPQHQTESVEKTVDEPAPFTIEVGTEGSPWSHANRILHAVLAEDAAVVKARQQAIPYAIDALEIARIHADTELKVDLTEEVIDDQGGDDVSELVAEVVTKTTAVKAVS